MTAAAIANRIDLNLPGGGRVVTAKYTFSTSYATSGELITPAQFSLASLLAVVPLGPASDGSDVLWIPATGALKVFRQGPIKPRNYVATGGAAGNITVTGVATGDILDAVWDFQDAAGILVDHTAEFLAGTAPSANTINNTGGTTTHNLAVFTHRPSDVQIPAEVASTTDLSGINVQLLIFGTV